MTIGDVTISEALVWFVAVCAGFATIMSAIKLVKEIVGKDSVKKQLSTLTTKNEELERKNAELEKRIKALEEREEKIKLMKLGERIEKLEKVVQGIGENLSVANKGIFALIDHALNIGTQDDLRDARGAYTDYFSNGGKKV